MSTNTPDTSAEARFRAAAERTIRRLTLERALTAAGAVGDDLELVADRMGRFVSLVERDGEIVASVVDDRGAERLASRGLPMTLDALAAEFREKYPRNFSKEGPATKRPIGFSPAPEHSPFKEPNPFESGNLTAQGRLLRADPALYETWRREAEGRPAPLMSPASGEPAVPVKVVSHSPAAPLTGDLGRFFRPGKDFNLTMQGRVFKEDRATYDAIKAAMAS